MVGYDGGRVGGGFYSGLQFVQWVVFRQMRSLKPWSKAPTHHHSPGGWNPLWLDLSPLAARFTSAHVPPHDCVSASNLDPSSFYGLHGHFALTLDLFSIS